MWRRRFWLRDEASSTLISIAVMGRPLVDARRHGYHDDGIDLRCGWARRD